MELIDLCVKLNDLKIKKKATEQEVKDINLEIVQVDNYIQDIYLNEGITQQKILGVGTVSMVETVRASMKDPELLFGHLRDYGEEAIIKETIHAQTLSAWYKSKLEEGMTEEALELLGVKCYRQRNIRITKWVKGQHN